MSRTAATICTFALLLAPAPLSAADAVYSIKTVASPAPKEIPAAIAKTLSEQSIQLLDAKGETLAEVWLRKAIPAKATAEQIKNGLTYREVPETTLLGAIRIVQPTTEYRRQKVKAGVYTLRLGFQPMDGDHMGTAPFNEFVLLIPADREESPEPLKDAEQLHQKSSKSTGTSHPGVVLLFPNNKPEDAPKLQNKGDGHWVLFAKAEASADGKKAPLGVGIAMVGHAAE
jgi:hypothetical protein